MGVRERVVRGKVTSEHVVQYFDSDESRIESVARFVGEGHRAGGPLIVIARPNNWTGILETVERSGIRARQALADGRILYFDALGMLDRISRHGTPEATLFEEGVGATVERVAQGERVYAYGEMVDILAQRGDFDEAMQLEDLWNRLLARVDVTLMCGYSAAHFVSDDAQEPLRQVCAAHSGVRVESQDPLAAWLLQQAQ